MLCFIIGIKASVELILLFLKNFVEVKYGFADLLHICFALRDAVKLLLVVVKALSLHIICGWLIFCGQWINVQVCLNCLYNHLTVVLFLFVLLSGTIISFISHTSILHRKKTYFCFSPLWLNFVQDALLERCILQNGRQQLLFQYRNMCAVGY